MDAIDLLKKQHRLVEKLFSTFEATEDDEGKQKIFEEIADNLAVHTAIEERIFYPAVRAQKTEEQLEEAFDEHLDAKKIILDALDDPDAPGFDGKVAALKGAIEHHVEEEEEELFASVKKLMTANALEALGQMMEAEALRMMQLGSPRLTIRLKAEAPDVRV
jgi:hemerythrin superfamily protein